VFRDTLRGMCRKVICRECGKPSWAGCGAHIESVLGDVPNADRCRCDEATSFPNSVVADGGLSNFERQKRETFVMAGLTRLV
jgi:hypothetical protein